MPVPAYLHHSHRKSRVLASVLVGLLIIITVRLFYIQVIQHDYYKKIAYQEQVGKFVLPAQRGKIYALNGNSTVPLVLNQPVYTAYADPQEIKNKDKIVNEINNIAGGTTEKNYQNRLQDKNLRYVILAKKLSHTQAQLLKKKNLAGVGLTKESQRVYPEGSLASQLLGYVNNEGSGQYGVEEALDDRLDGKPGKLQAVTDVRRIPLTVSKDDISIPATDGDNLVLSIDVTLQNYVEAALKQGLRQVNATKGSIIVMNPNNGQVMAMANYPTYNPTRYGDVDDYSVFQNKVVSAPYEVGSVMKTLTMGVGLDRNVVSTNTTFNNTGFVQVDDTEIKNVEEDPINPNATMTDILQYSLNTGAVFVLQQLGGGSVNRQARDVLYDYYYNHYRFGRSSGIEQANESKGIIIAPNKVQGNNVRYANMSFGQGMDITMLQMTSAFSAAINDGIFYKPTLLAGTVDQTKKVQPYRPTILKKAVLQSNTSKTLRQMIVDGRQRGYFGGDDKKGYRVGGKTGTSQIIDPATGKYTDDDSIGSYIGFGGNKTPKYVIMVKVEDSKAPGYAGTTAAGPIFTDVSNWLIDYLQIPPR